MGCREKSSSSFLASFGDIAFSEYFCTSTVFSLYGESVRAVIPFILDVRIVDVPAGITQEEGHTGFLRLPSFLPSAVLALIFLARSIQPFLSLVDCEVDFFVLTN